MALKPPLGGRASVWKQFLASAAAEKLSAWLTLDHLRDRAKHARRDDFIQFLEKSPSAPPLPGDETD